MPNPNRFSLSHQIHGKSASPSLCITNGRKTPEIRIVFRVLAIWNHFRLGHVGVLQRGSWSGRQGHNANCNGLWEDGEIMPGDTDNNSEALRIDQLQMLREWVAAQWWRPSTICQLYCETEAEQHGINLAFQKLHPLHSRQPLNSQFLLDQSRLHQRLDRCPHLEFLLLTHSPRQHVPKVPPHGRAPLLHSAPLMLHSGLLPRLELLLLALRKPTEYLAGWLAHMEDSIHSWGTVDDPRNPLPLPGWGTGGWGTGGWGTAATGGWGMVGTGGTGGWGVGVCSSSMATAIWVPSSVTLELSAGVSDKMNIDLGGFDSWSANICLRLAITRD
ncbi:hypothetical protein DFH08DRAFT_815388 [Mycena albidolilacea]|uniref:Uncharacterized protein n=1 Tax=Mycena albidolilacea TaxID=1033008 RepID=A0AAD6ZMS2_9AGAR|nr:hypothetical protein DFH08DRAFT_815388 [Mycena albidolilacea]